jgi:hypothetical protein
LTGSGEGSLPANSGCDIHQSAGLVQKGSEERLGTINIHFISLMANSINTPIAP